MKVLEKNIYKLKHFTRNNQTKMKYPILSVEEYINISGVKTVNKLIKTLQENKKLVDDELLTCISNIECNYFELSSKFTDLFHKINTTKKYYEELTILQNRLSYNKKHCKSFSISYNRNLEDMINNILLDLPNEISFYELVNHLKCKHIVEKNKYPKLYTIFKNHNIIYHIKKILEYV